MSLATFEPRSGAQHASEDATGLRSTIIHDIKAYAASRPRQLQTEVGPSQVGTPCSRQLAYQVAETPPNNDRKDIHDPWPSIVGTATHAWLADAMEYANRQAAEQGLPQPWHVERRVDVGLGLEGNADVYHISGVVLDYKVLGNTTYRQYTTEGPSQTYRTQAHCYGFGYLRAGFDVKRVAIGFFGRSKKLSDLHIWSEPFDADIALHALKRLRTVHQLVSAGVDPTRVPATPGGACWYCSWRGPESDGFCPGRGE